MATIQELIANGELSQTDLDAHTDEAKAGLVTSKDKVLQEKADLTKQVNQINAMGGIDAFQALQTAQTTAEQKAADSKMARAKEKGDMDAITATHTAQLEAKDKMISDLTSKMVNEHISGDITKSIAGHNGNNELLQPLVTSRVSGKMTDNGIVVEVRNQDGSLMLDETGNPATIEHLVSSLEKNENYGVAFAASGKTGAGSQQSGNVQATGRPILDAKHKDFDFDKAIEWQANASPEEIDAVELELGK